MARRLLQEEGLFCGGSSGAIVSAAINYAKREKLGKDVRIVCLMADNLRNYLTKFLQKEWMVDKKLMAPSELVQEGHRFIKVDLNQLKLNSIPNFTQKTTLQEAIDALQKYNIPSLPIVSDLGDKIIAAVPQERIMNSIITKNLRMDATVSEVWSKEFSSV